MAKVTNQNVPSEYGSLWDDAMTTYPWVWDEDNCVWRHPFRIPPLQGCRTIRPAIKRGSLVTDAMCLNRKIFGGCVECFQRQPITGGATPPAWGPRNRSWWYNDAVPSGLFYYTWFMEETMNAYIQKELPTWCVSAVTGQCYVTSWAPTTVYNGKSRFLAAVCGASKSRSFFQRTNPTQNFLWIYIRTAGTCEAEPTYAKHVLYDVPDDLGIWPYSWNTQPPVGNILDIRTPPQHFDAWQRFYIGDALTVALYNEGENNSWSWEGIISSETEHRPQWA